MMCWLRIILGICGIFALTAQAATPKTAGALIDFGEHYAGVHTAFNQEKPLRWVQFGDSHTAGEYFTGELRSQMQRRLGDGGPGWLFPGYVRQQRFELAKLTNAAAWELVFSRAASAAGGAAGGVEASAHKAGAGYALHFKQALPKGNYAFKALLQPLGTDLAAPLLKVANGGLEAVLSADANAPAQSWQVLISTYTDPLAEWQIVSPQANAVRVAGAWIDVVDSKNGATLDALGLNGGKAETTALWDAASLAAWLQERQPTVVALAYGTNEALDPQFSPLKFNTALSALIQAIRRHSNAAVLLISPPDLYMPPKRTVKQTVRLANGKKKTVNKTVKLKVACDAALPVSYEGVHKALRTLAAKEKTLYWDWQQAMGGRCAMREAAQETPPLAQPDGVHMTAEGYATYGRLLWADVLKWQGLK
jgi:lysophospholipase L1-like esterase